MWDIFVFSFNAIAPIVFVTALGYFLKRIHILNQGFVKAGNKLVFYVLLPVMLFYNIYNIDSLSSIDMSVVLYAVIAIIVIFLLGLLGVCLFCKDRKQKGVILQCIFRSNFSIIGIPIAEALGGSVAVSYAAILSAFSIPLFNIFAVISLTIFHPEREDGVEEVKISKGKMIGNTLLKIVKNPLIIGVVIGLIVLAIRQAIPTNAEGDLVFSIRNTTPALMTIINYLQRCSTPLALLFLGAQFEFSVVKHLWKQITVSTICRLVLVPVSAISIAILLSKYTNILNFSSSVYPAYIALFASPVAVSSVIMAGEMKNDESLAAQLVVWTSLFAIVTIFLFVLVLSSLGVISIS